MVPLALIGQLLPKADDGKREFKEGEFVIRDKTLAVGNDIYSIANVSGVSLVDLRRTVPPMFWIAVALGAWCMLSGGAGVAFGFLFLCAAAYIFFLHWKATSTTDFMLAINLNSGTTAAILSDDIEFLKLIVLELYRVIELDVPSHAVFNIDRSVKIDRVTGSSVAVGTVSGDIVNHVLAGV